MDAPKYPKVETLFERGDGWRETGELPLVNFGGRTDRAQMRADLLEVLSASFTRARCAEVFDQLGDGGQAVVFGEGYGPGVQKAGGRYRAKDAGVSFRAFDVLVRPASGERWVWLLPKAVEEVAGKFGFDAAPRLGWWTTAEVVDHVRAGFASVVAAQDPGGDPSFMAEGVVARAPRGMLDRLGNRIAFKLKTRDFLGRDGR